MFIFLYFLLFTAITTSPTSRARLGHTTTPQLHYLPRQPQRPLSPQQPWGEAAAETTTEVGQVKPRTETLLSPGLLHRHVGIIARMSVCLSLVTACPKFVTVATPGAAKNVMPIFVLVYLLRHCKQT